MLLIINKVKTSLYKIIDFPPICNYFYICNNLLYTKSDASKNFCNNSCL